MGPNPNGPRSVSYDRAIRYSGSGVHSVDPVGDFLEFVALNSSPMLVLGHYCFIGLVYEFHNFYN